MHHCQRLSCYAIKLASLQSLLSIRKAIETYHTLSLTSLERENKKGMHSEKWYLQIVDYENRGLFMYRSLGLTSAEPKALILIIRILIKVNAFLEENCVGFTL